MKSATVRVLGQIVLAFLGLAGTALGVWSQMRTADTDAVLKVSVDRMGEEVLPPILRKLESLERDNRVLIDSLGLLRERVAKMEGRLDERGRIARNRPRRSPASADAPPPGLNATVSASRGDVDRQLDTLILKGAAEPLEIPRMDYQQIQEQAQEAK